MVWLKFCIFITVITIITKLEWGILNIVISMAVIKIKGDKIRMPCTHTTVI